MMDWILSALSFLLVLTIVYPTVFCGDLTLGSDNCRNDATDQTGTFCSKVNRGSFCGSLTSITFEGPESASRLVFVIDAKIYHFEKDDFGLKESYYCFKWIETNRKWFSQECVDKLTRDIILFLLNTNYEDPVTDEVGMNLAGKANLKGYYILNNSIVIVMNKKKAIVTKKNFEIVYEKRASTKSPWQFIQEAHHKWCQNRGWWKRFMAWLYEYDCKRDSDGEYVHPWTSEKRGGGSSGGLIYDRPSFLGPDYGSSFGRYKRAINSTGPETILNEFKLKNPMSIVQLGNSSLAWAIEFEENTKHTVIYNFELDEQYRFNGRAYRDRLYLTFSEGKMWLHNHVEDASPGMNPFYSPPRGFVLYTRLYLLDDYRGCVYRADLWNETNITRIKLMGTPHLKFDLTATPYETFFKNCTEEPVDLDSNRCDYVASGKSWRSKGIFSTWYILLAGVAIVLLIAGLLFTFKTIKGRSMKNKKTKSSALVKAKVMKNGKGTTKSQSLNSTGKSTSKLLSKPSKSATV